MSYPQKRPATWFILILMAFVFCIIILISFWVGKNWDEMRCLSEDACLRHLELGMVKQGLMVRDRG
jgi:hypothetical protein